MTHDPRSPQTSKLERDLVRVRANADADRERFKRWAADIDRQYRAVAAEMASLADVERGFIRINRALRGEALPNGR